MELNLNKKSYNTIMEKLKTNFNQFINENKERNKVLIINMNYDIAYSDKLDKQIEILKPFKLYDEAFEQLGNDMGLKMSRCTFNDINYIGDTVYNGNTDLKDYDFIFIGLLKTNIAPSKIVLNYINKNNIQNMIYGDNYTKLDDMYNLFCAHLPHIPSIITSNPDDAINYIKNKLDNKYPVISKILNGSKGKGVIKCDSEEELIKSFGDEKTTRGSYESLRMVQQFIPNEGDYRILIFNGDLLYAVKRKTADKEKEFRNNISLGGKIEYNVKLPIEAKNIAVDCAKYTNKDIAGVDLIQSADDKKWYILEVNGAPQFVISPEIGADLPIKILKLIKQKLNLG